MISGVYFLIKDFDIVYIGSSCDIELRLKYHHIKDYDYYVVFTYRSYDKRFREERHFISTYQPKFNKMHTQRWWLEKQKKKEFV